MDNSSGVGVLDKTVAVLNALEAGPASLAQLVSATGLARPTAHRIAVALERHRVLTRDGQGRFVLGPRITELAAAAGEDRLLAVAQPVLAQLRDMTGESAQLYRRQGDARICVAAAERASGLRDTVPVGAVLPMTAGSAAQILLAWEEPDRLHRGLRGAKFSATALAQVRRRGWAASVAERELGVASVSAPVRGQGGKVIAAASVSGPIERLTRSPGRLHAVAVVAASDKNSDSLRRGAGPRRGCCPRRIPRTLRYAGRGRRVPAGERHRTPALLPRRGDDGQAAVLIGLGDLGTERLRRPWPSQDGLAAILVLCHHVRTLPHEGMACATRPDAGQPVRLVPTSLEAMRSCP